MNTINKKITLGSLLFALLFVATGVSAMTISDDQMMKKESTMSDTMMDKDDTMMKDESMMKKEEMTMVPKFDLAIGSTGEEVIVLQTLLVSKGLLVMPSGVQMGYFGLLTKAALMSYQSGHDLPSTGYFGPLTRAMMAKGEMKMDDEMMKKESMVSDTMMDKDDTMMKDESMMKKEVR